MAIRINTTLRNAMVDAVKTVIDAGSSAARVRIYTGAQPPGPGSAPTGTLLLEVPLNDPSFGGSANGAITAGQAPALSANGAAAGTAGWFRIVDSTEAAGSGLGIVDGSVTASGGGGECELSTTAISVGLTVTITALTITQPAS